MSIDLLLYAVIAGVLVLWLRNTLGSTNGSEEDRSEIIEHLRRRSEEQTSDSSRRDSTLPETFDDAPLSAPPAGSPFDGIELEGTEDEIRNDLLSLMTEMPGFTPKIFVTGAKEAFALVVEAFARGDLKTLKMLLSPSVYRAFETAVEDRRTRGETLTTDVQAVRACRILDVSRIGKSVFIKVRIIAEEITVTRDREGHVISGNPDRAVSMNDVWTFGKEIRSSDPTWYLYETSDDVIDEIANPRPDAK